MQTEEINRDERGRVLAADGYPTAGLASITEAVSVSGLSRSMIYLMINRGELETKRFGKSRRITWASIRQTFLSSEVNS
jgi:predicted DNA-binding transcriptional regulator AlpA